MRFLFTLLFFAGAMVNSKAQFYKSVMPTTAGFNQSLEQIVRDFKYNYKNISGAAMVTEGEYDTFESTVLLPGATNCVVYKYHSKIDTTASWQAVMYQGDDFREAVKVYKNTYQQLKKSKIQLVDKTVVSMTGDYQEPTEDLRFAVSTLRLQLADVRYRRFAAELELVSSYMGWQVNVHFANKKPDDERY